MKKIYALLFTLLLINTAFALGKFEKGDNAINLGIGFGSSLLTVGSGYSSSPLLSASFEHGIWEIPGPGIISLGGYIGYKSYQYDYNYVFYSYKQKWNYTILGVRGAYHYNGLKVDKIDVYGGVLVSFNIVSYTYTNTGSTIYSDPGNYSSRPGATAFVGGRYFLTDNIALYSEVGFGVGFLNFGVTFKF